MKTSPMKPLFRIAATVLVFLTWAGAPVAVAQTDVTYYSRFNEMYAVKRANVRTGPGTNFAKVGLLGVGQKVRVTARRGNWFKLTGLPKQPSRFVYAPLLTRTKPLAKKERTITSASSKRTIRYKNGARYYGQTRSGRPHGRGVYTQTDGYRHEGEYRDGKFHGPGVLVYANGDRYEGNFVNGAESGRGVLVYADTGRNEDNNAIYMDRYEGEFRDGDFHGSGILSWTGGYRFEGEWVNGQRHGVGWEMQADGSGFRATWSNGKAGRKDYRRDVWESDRRRWLRKSGFETQTASTARKPKAQPSPREAGNNQASADAKELWGVYVETWYRSTSDASRKYPSYSIVWNASSPDIALRKALELCQSKVGIPCWPPRHLDWDTPSGGREGTFMPWGIRFFSTSSDGQPMEELVGKELIERGMAYNSKFRCRLVYNAPWNDERPEDIWYDTHVGNTPEEVRKEFEEDSRTRLGGSGRIELIACNDR